MIIVEIDISDIVILTQILPASSDQLICKSVITEPATPPGDPEAIVAAVSRAVATLSREIARAIQAEAG